MSEKEHWETVYTARPAERLGWYEPHLWISLGWIKELNLSPDAPIIDVGGGVSTLVDDLLEAGHRALTVLDISAQALSRLKARLGEKADLVTWMEGDIASTDLPHHYFELWHDRAVLHFLTTLGYRVKYRINLLNALKPGGHLIIGTFAPEAPPRCSGLPVQRYTPEQLQDLLGAEFALVDHQKELHITPGGVEQMYLYCHFHRRA